MLYRTCGGSLSPRLRWKITAQTIRPQTTHPTSIPAIHDPCHSETTILPCVVTGSGKPIRVNVSFVHPVRASIMTASTPTPAALERRRRVAVPRATGAACRRFRVNEAPSQTTSSGPHLTGPVHGLLQRVVHTVSRAWMTLAATPEVSPCAAG